MPTLMLQEQKRLLDNNRLTAVFTNYRRWRGNYAQVNITKSADISK